MSSEAYSRFQRYIFWGVLFLLLFLSPKTEIIILHIETQPTCLKNATVMPRDEDSVGNLTAQT